MKVFTNALIALAMSIALSACGTLTTVRSVHVYPATTQVAQIAQVEEAPQSLNVEPSQIAQATVETTTPAPPAPAFAFSDEQVRCMALAIYHEARGERPIDQAAVGWVIVNRMQHSGYPLNGRSKRGNATVCDIVQDAKRTSAGRVVPNACQFSWYCDNRTDTPRELAAYRRAEATARGVLSREIPNPIGKAIYFDGHVHLVKRGRTYGNVVLGNHRFFVGYVARR